MKNEIGTEEEKEEFKDSGKTATEDFIDFVIDLGYIFLCMPLWALRSFEEELKR